jgi:hypothetical protein
MGGGYSLWLLRIWGERVSPWCAPDGVCPEGYDINPRETIVRINRTARGRNTQRYRGRRPWIPALRHMTRIAVQWRRLAEARPSISEIGHLGSIGRGLISRPASRDT